MSANYSPLGYCTRQDVQNLLLLTIDDSFADQITDWIAAAEAQANSFMGYTQPKGLLEESVSNEITAGRVTSDGDLAIFPRKPPVTAVSAISLVKGTTEVALVLTMGGLAKYTIPSSQDQILYPAYELSTTGTSVIGSFSSLRAAKFYTKISYTGGYDAVPADVRLATANLVADTVMRHSNKEGLESITQGRVSKRFWARQDGHSDFYLDAMDLLQGYRISSRWL